MMKGKILLFLFAMPFFGVGVWMGYSIGCHLYDAWRMQGWAVAEATLHTAGYHTRSGDDSTTYEAYAEYSYNFEGEFYVNDRVAIARGGDNIGDYQQATGRRLSTAMSRGEPVYILVNPAMPSESVVDASLRWGLLGFKAIFFLVFGGIGLGMLIAVFGGPSSEASRGPEPSEQPWLENREWQTGIIRSDSRRSMWVAWIFAIIWNLISAPLPFAIQAEIVDNGNLVALVGFLFPLIGAGLFWRAVVRTMEWRRFGAAPLALDPFPGSIGGHVGGVIHLDMPFEHGTRFTITLTCLESYLSGTGTDRSRRERAEWQDKRLAYAMPGPEGTRLSFRFDVPDGLPESAAARGDNYHLWRLNLRAELSGADIDRDYRIPVYATAESSRELAGVGVEAAMTETDRIGVAALAGICSVEHGVNGRVLRYPMGRNRYAGVTGLVFGGIFAAAGWLLASAAGSPVIGSVFGLVGCLIGASSFYLMSNSLELTMQGDTLRVVRRVLGFRVSVREMARDDFAGFDTKRSMSTQAGSRHVVYYRLFAVDQNGRRVTVGEGFSGASQADAAGRMVAAEFGLEPAAGPAVTPAAAGGYNLLASD